MKYSFRLQPFDWLIFGGFIVIIILSLKCIFVLVPYHVVLQSTGSFFHDKSITLGSLIGVSSILEFSRRSIRGRKTEPSKDKKSTKSRIWFFSLCLRDNSSTDDARRGNNASSLGHFLAVERRAADDYRRNLENPSVIGPDELALAQPFAEPNSLFVDGRVAPPQTGSDMERGKDNGFGVPLLCSCMCGQPSE